MYRYSNRSRFNNIMRSNRYRPILVIVLIIVAAFVLLKLVGVGGLSEAHFESQRNAKLRSEIQHAVSQTNTLSRLGATSTSNILGRIRQYVHGIEVLNDLNVSMFGEVGRLYAQSTFDDIYTIIDTYDARLSSGQKVNDSLASLIASITNLSNTTIAIIGASAQ
ncbi:MAG: hypothetical protein VB087_00285 [Candidatus Limiplasma sp.]|nr:hypothetical protein [Candidatus Limiplasma sp.]MEA5146055.1 hypothetical protein [Candidatus Limiplasma sp.]